MFAEPSAPTATEAVSKVDAERLAALRQVVDTASIIVWRTNADDVCVCLNKSVRQILQGVGDVRLSDWLQFVHPEDLPGAVARLQHARSTQDDYQYEYRIVRSDGSVRWMMGSGAPHYGVGGEFTGYSGTIIDVSSKYMAHEQLAAREAQYRLLADNSLDLTCQCDQKGRYLYASPSYEHTLGYAPNELIGTDALLTVHPDDVPLLKAEVDQLGSSAEQSRTIEIRKKRRDGSYLWMGVKVKVIVDPSSGERLGSVSILRDISHERRAREDLRRSEERFRSLSQMSSDWVWETDANDVVTYVTDGIERVMGIPSAMFVGRPRWNLARQMDEAQLALYNEKLRLREPYRDLLVRARHPITGDFFHISISGEPFFHDGTFQGYRGVGRDVTALHELIKENSTLVENSLDVIARMDGAGNFLQVRGAVLDVLGYPAQELIGAPYLQFVHPEDRSRMDSANRDLREGDGKLKNIELRWIRQDGNVSYLASSVHWIRDLDQYYLTVRDITDAHVTRQEKQNADHQLKMMLENLSDAFFALDNDWRILYANAKAAAFVGVDRDTAIGRPLLEVEPQLEHTPAYPLYLQAMQEKRNVQFEIYYEPSKAWTETRIYADEHGLSIFFQDITERRMAEISIQESEQRFRRMIDITPAGYLETDGAGAVKQVNPAFCAMTGYEAQELVGQHLGMLFSFCPAEGQLAVQGGLRVVQGKDATLRHKNGQDMHALINLAIARDSEGFAQSLSAFVTDISERKESERQLELLATHDALTGLPNRVFINRRIQASLSDIAADKNLAVMLIDLDRFKEVNDSMGHAAGDEMLRQVAARLQHCIGQTDTVGRLGGDEFIVVANCSNGRQDAARIAESILATFHEPFVIDDREFFASGSIGISMFSQTDNSEEVLFQNADLAMYRAKATGRNRYHFFESEMGSESKQRMNIEQALRRALDRGEFKVFYQPRISLETLEVAGFEALLRWDNPELGRVPPSVFIPIAEDKGFINDIGLWVLQQACQDTKRLVDELGREMHVSVNLSAHQLKYPCLVEKVRCALNDSGLPAHLLELEITESALIEDVDKSAAVLRQLKQSGVLLSVDDFGTGYSSLAYLKRFPVDILKLDRSFINHSTEGVNTLEFIKAVVGMAHSLNLSVVAEGIEITEMLNLLSTAACDEGQGFLFAKPMPLGDLKEWLYSRLDYRVLDAA